jgi:hypothetical protein
LEINGNTTKRCSETFKDIVKDRDLILARHHALKILQLDVAMQLPEHASMRAFELTKKKIYGTTLADFFSNTLNLLFFSV